MITLCIGMIDQIESLYLFYLYMDVKAQVGGDAGCWGGGQTSSCQTKPGITIKKISSRLVGTRLFRETKQRKRRETTTTKIARQTSSTTVGIRDDAPLDHLALD